MSLITPDMATRVPVLDRAFALLMSLIVVLATFLTFAAAPAVVSAAEGEQLWRGPHRPGLRDRSVGEHEHR